MNLRDELLLEHSKKQTVRIGRYVGSDDQRFAELAGLVLSNEPVVSQRAAWALSHCAELHPRLVISHLSKLVTNLDRADLHDAVKRNTLRILEMVEIPSKLQGRLADRCFSYLSGSEPPAVKAYSITILYNICKFEPGLANELKLVIEAQWDYASAAVLSRGKKVLKGLVKMQ